MNISSSATDLILTCDDDDVCSFTTASSSNDSFYSSYIPLCSSLDSTFSSLPKNFNVVHINAQSIPAHFPDLVSSFSNANIHAILVSETFLKPFLPSSSFSLPNFHLIRNDRIGKGGGGVAIYLRNHIPFSILSKSDSKYSESAEHLFIEVLIGRAKLLLGVFYSPSLHIDYFDGFENILELFVSNADHTIIMGDFNTCLIKNDVRAKRLLNIINSSNLNTLPSKATHYFPNCSPSLLDLSFVSSLHHVESHGQFPAEGFSYHDLIYLSYKIRPPKLRPTVVMRRSFKNFKNDLFLKELNSIDWNSIFNVGTIDEKLELFNSLLTELFDKHAPFRPIKLKHLPAPWLTQEIRALMLKRNRAKCKYKLNPSDINLTKYKHLRNRCSKVCRDAQRQYIHSSIENSKPSKIWKFLQTLGIGRQPSTISHNLDLDALNGFFASTIPMDSREKLNSLNHLLSLPVPGYPSFHFTPVNHSDIKFHIFSIKSDATGSDGINRKMILLLLNTILPVLSHIFNFSLSSGEFPSAWRKAHVLPIPKVKNPESFSNYRPICILPFLSKVLERIVHSQLYGYLYK